MLDQADKLLETEARVKAALGNSAGEWSSKIRDLPTRAAAAGAVAAGTAVSAACPLAGPVAFPAGIAASAAIHSAYHFSDGARSDARSKAKTTFFNRIKSYDWLDETVMSRSELKELYAPVAKAEKELNHAREKLEQTRRKIETGERKDSADAVDVNTAIRDVANAEMKFRDEKEALRTTLSNEKNPFNLKMLSGAMVFPVEARLGMADRLLRGKLAETIDKALLAREQLRGTRVCNPDPALRVLLADVFNIRKAQQLMDEAAASTERGEAEERMATVTQYLLKIADQEVRDLFTGTMAEQAAAGARVRKLTKGELDKYRISFAANAALGTTLGPLYSTCAAISHLADAGEHIGAHAQPVEISRMSGPMGAAAGANVGLSPESTAKIHTFAKQRANAVRPYERSTDIQPAPEIRLLSLNGRPVEADALSVPTDRIAKLMSMSPNIMLSDGTTSFSIRLDDTEPYYNGARRALSRRARARLFISKVGQVGDIVQQTVRAPLARMIVTRNARQTWHARQDLRAQMSVARGRIRNAEPDVPAK